MEKHAHHAFHGSSPNQVAVPKKWPIKSLKCPSGQALDLVESSNRQMPLHCCHGIVHTTIVVSSMPLLLNYRSSCLHVLKDPIPTQARRPLRDADIRLREPSQIRRQSSGDLIVPRKRDLKLCNTEVIGCDHHSPTKTNKKQLGL